MGFLDLHIHGAFGVDVTTAGPEELDRLSRSLGARGVEGYLPTLVPLPPDERRAAVARLSAYVRARRPGDGRGALPLGIHLEGPFVSHARCGALCSSLFLDGNDPAAVEELLADVDDVPGRRMVTLAPEIPGGLALVRRLADRGFLVAIGHTEADASTLDAALRAGARHMTHFANAMRPLHHREVGPVGWGLLNDGVTVDVIADLAHLSPEMLRLVYKAKGPERVALISDAVPPAGLGDGPHAVWGETLTMRDGAVRNAAGALAGSACLLDEAVARAVSIGIPEDLARRSAWEVPRRILALSA